MMSMVRIPCNTVNDKSQARKKFHGFLMNLESLSVIQLSFALSMQRKQKPQKFSLHLDEM